MNHADKIETLPIDALVPYARNARTHSDAQIAQIAASIREFGFTNPVLIDGKGGIVAGHGRVLAAKSLGVGGIPCLRVDWLTEAQRRAYVLADNQLALQAGWDNDLLAGELRALQADGFDLALTGFSGDDLADMLFEPPPPQSSEDDVPNPSATATSQQGDLWILGAHRLLCGDSCKQEDADHLMGGALADMAFTDPPYGVNYAAGSAHDSLVRAGKAHEKHRAIENDALSDADQSSFWLAAFQRLAAALRPGAAYYVCSPQGGRMMMMMMQQMCLAGIPQRHEIIWLKNSMVLGRADYHYKHEPILYGWKEGAGHTWYGDRSQTSVWEFNKPQKSELHPTMKPVELVERALANSSKIGDIVLDLFGGSGTTMIAAEKTGRACRMMELDRHYCDVIIRRWQQYTGQTATHAVTGEPFPG